VWFYAVGRRGRPGGGGGGAHGRRSRRFPVGWFLPGGSRTRGDTPSPAGKRRSWTSSIPVRS